jgi:predicted  nucleic acid-binding Zn-ribbon protein
VHNALDEMKNSLSFISSKLVTNETKGSLSTNEISELQSRLASTEAQMSKILNALDAASTKVNELSQNTRKSLEQSQQVNLYYSFIVILTYLIIDLYQRRRTSTFIKRK